MGSMLMAVQEDEHHLVISVDGQPICVAGEGIFHDVPMSDHLTTVVLLGEAGFPVSHTPDTLYMLHSPTHLLKVMGGDHLSLKERVSAAKMLVAYVHEERGNWRHFEPSLRPRRDGKFAPAGGDGIGPLGFAAAFLPALGGSGETMVNQFIDLLVRLTRHRPGHQSDVLQRFVDVHAQAMRRKDQERLRDQLLALCETSRHGPVPAVRDRGCACTKTRVNSTRTTYEAWLDVWFGHGAAPGDRLPATAPSCGALRRSGGRVRQRPRRRGHHGFLRWCS